jgi:DsbC/DsbD-like thiol-disulfide interchange protein
MFRPLALLALSAAPAVAEDPADVRLLHGWREGDRHVAAVEIAMPPGWHTYWRAPGASGIPPQFDWSGSTNLRSVRIEWSHPDVFESFGARTIGYRNTVVLPIVIEAADPDAAIELSLGLTFGACKDVCVPDYAELDGRLEPAEAPAGERAPIEQALARRAQGPHEAGIVEATCRLAPEGGGLSVSATVRLSNDPAREPVAVIEAASRPDLWIGEAQSQTTGPVVTAQAPVETAGNTGPVLDRRALRLTLIDPVRYVEIEGCRAPG